MSCKVFFLGQVDSPSSSPSQMKCTKSQTIAYLATLWLFTCLFYLVHGSGDTSTRNKQQVIGKSGPAAANSTAIAILSNSARQLIVLDQSNDIQAASSELKSAESHHHHSHHKKHHKKHHKSKCSPQVIVLWSINFFLKFYFPFQSITITKSTRTTNTNITSITITRSMNTRKSTTNTTLKRDTTRSIIMTGVVDSRKR